MKETIDLLACKRDNELLYAILLDVVTKYELSDLKGFDTSKVEINLIINGYSVSLSSTCFKVDKTIKASIEAQKKLTRKKAKLSAIQQCSEGLMEFMCKHLGVEEE